MFVSYMTPAWKRFSVHCRRHLPSLASFSHLAGWTAERWSHEEPQLNNGVAIGAEKVDAIPNNDRNGSIVHGTHEQSTCCTSWKSLHIPTSASLLPPLAGSLVRVDPPGGATPVEIPQSLTLF